MLSRLRFVALGAALAVAGSGTARAQTMPDQHPMASPSTTARMPQNAREEMQAAPTMAGQDAFGAVQEVVRNLEADPRTDWSKVHLEALRQHLIDMNEVVLNADAVAKEIEGGLEIAVTGSGRTLAAIERMIPAHAAEIDGLNFWRARTAPLPNGVLLTVTSGHSQQVQHIRGLGFIGLLVSGAHHQGHHLAIARGGG